MDVSIWIQNARKGKVVFKKQKPSDYPEQWWLWWNGINPSWRARENGRPVQGGVGPWDSLFKPGPNGFYTVLGSLLALREAATNESWRAGLKDVGYVLREVASAAAAQSSR